MFSFTPMPHEEAQRRIAELPIVSREVMQGLLPELRAHAFTVAGLSKASQMSRVKKILEGVPAGENWDTAKRGVIAELRAAGITGKEAPRRAETLLRTTAFRAYAATRHQVLMRQTDVFPFWQYKTAGDGRVRPAHTALHNRIFPAGHEIWQRIFPPWGWGCRCLVVPLTKRTAERMGAQGEELRAKGGESLPAEGGLLKGQRQAPTLHTPKEADLISQSARLPGGISLEVEPSWGRAPWSEKGNLRPSWEYLEGLYSEDPEAFAAFREWAGKTEISKGQTVSMWIEGAEGAGDVKAVSEVSTVSAVKPAAPLRSIVTTPRPAVRVPRPSNAQPAAPKVEAYMRDENVEAVAIAEVNAMTPDEVKRVALEYAKSIGLSRGDLENIQRSRGRGEARSRAIQAMIRDVRRRSDALKAKAARKNKSTNAPEADPNDDLVTAS